MEFKAGRELDALVAERVMGWAHVSLRDGKIAGALPLIPGTVTAHCAGDIPHYSTSIAAAWTVLKRIQSLGHPMEPFRELWTDDVDLDRLPLLICLAALKTVGVL